MRRLRRRLWCTNTDGEPLARAQSNSVVAKLGSGLEQPANGGAQPRSYNEAPRRCLWCDDERRRELTPDWPWEEAADARSWTCLCVVRTV
jgi:hypothetical protein